MHGGRTYNGIAVAKMDTAPTLVRTSCIAQASLRDRITAAPLGTPPPSPARQGALLHQSASSPAAIPSQVRCQHLDLYLTEGCLEREQWMC